MNGGDGNDFLNNYIDMNALYGCRQCNSRENNYALSITFAQSKSHVSNMLSGKSKHVRKLFHAV